MGKYMRKRRAPAARDQAASAAGVRTRSRTAAGAASGGVVAPKRSKVLPPAAEPGSGGDAESCCYLQLRSRMVFKSRPPSSPDQKDPAGAAEPAGGHGAPLAAVLSRCSSTASSAAQEFTEACGDHVPEASASESRCGHDGDRRETTPSSQARDELRSDLESDLAGQNSGGSFRQGTASPPAQPVMPPASETEKFFAAAEEAEAERCASKYNFDVVRGLPVGAGRFEWTPAPAVSI